MLDRTIPSKSSRRGAACSVTEITVLVCELKPYPIWFSCRRKSYSLSEQLTIWECALVVYHVFSYIYASAVEHLNNRLYQRPRRFVWLVIK